MTEKASEPKPASLPDPKYFVARFGGRDVPQGFGTPPIKTPASS